MAMVVRHGAFSVWAKRDGGLGWGRDGGVVGREHRSHKRAEGPVAAEEVPRQTAGGRCEKKKRKEEEVWTRGGPDARYVGVFCQGSTSAIQTWQGKNFGKPFFLLALGTGCGVS